MTLHHYHFDRDKSIELRVRSGAPDPFFVRTFDFNLPGIIPPDRLAALVTWLVATHDAFRTSLQFDGRDALCARLFEGGLPPVHREEVDGIAALTAERGSFLEKNRHRIDLFGGPLAVFYYFHSPRENKSLLRILCSHFASDQQTYRLLVEQLTRFFSNRQGETSAGSYLDWMDAYWTYASGAEGHKELKFWAGLPSEPFVRARKAMIATTDGGAQKVTLDIPAGMLAALQNQCRSRWRCRPVDAITVALCLAIGREFGLGHVPLTWSAHGRFPLAGKKFSHTAGWLSGRHPLLVPVDSTSKTGLAQGFRDTLLGVPTWGSSFTWVTRFCGGPGALDLELGLKAPVTMNIQEGPRQSPGPPVVAEQLTEPPALLVEPEPSSDLNYPMYCLINLGHTVRIAYYCQGNILAEPVQRLMRAASACLYDYAYRDADEIQPGPETG